jgi:hypothetical protein
MDASRDFHSAAPLTLATGFDLSEAPYFALGISFTGIDRIDPPP